MAGTATRDKVMGEKDKKLKDDLLLLRAFRWILLGGFTYIYKPHTAGLSRLLKDPI